MLRVMLIDDEPLALQGLKELLLQIPGVEIVSEASSAAEALENIPKVQPDALFLDVRLRRRDGFELLSGIENPPPVVFFTAHSEYAVRAFEVQAVDYLLKPVRLERLRAAVDRLLAARETRKDIQRESPAYAVSDRICLRTPERTVVAPVAGIVLLEADGDFTRIVVAETQPLLICQTLGAYERILPAPPFLRLDRSVMINLSAVRSLEISPSRGAFLKLEGLPTPLPLGRVALKRLRAAFPNLPRPA